MNPMQSVEADFDSVRRIRDNLYATSRSLNDISAVTLPDHINTLKAFWNEESTNAFMAKEIRLINEMGGEIGQMTKIIDSINLKAEGLYRAESINVGIGRNRGY